MKSIKESIVKRDEARIRDLLSRDDDYAATFSNFVTGLRKNINEAITEDEAVEMLAQHIITKPIFDALFTQDFVKNNPISQAMQSMIDLLNDKAIDKETEKLNKFYDSVRMRAEGIDNAEGKQRIIIELYDKFFRAAFPKMVQKLGIVYTPVEAVDFMIHFTDQILRKEFGRGLTDENIHILDPFAGTGTFITRILQSGLIRKEDLKRKFTKELHFNEIVLLAYYIASVNVENAYRDASGDTCDVENEVGCLTDTFQMGESDDDGALFSEIFPVNSERITNQKKAPLRVIIGNPPYSVGQRSANDNAQNQSYPKLDSDVRNTYNKESTSKKVQLDSYIKAFRWASNRILENEDGGVICFISNGGWVDRSSNDGFRKVIERDFSSIYVLNLRGNARTSGEQRRKEKDNIFQVGSRSTIAITMLVKQPNCSKDRATIHYHDIGDYLSREDKLGLLTKFSNYSNIESGIEWTNIIPNEHGDWLNQRSDGFENYVPLRSKKKFDENTKSYFVTDSSGVATHRDVWVYNFSKHKLIDNVQKTLDFYNEQAENYRDSSITNPRDFVVYDDKSIKWTFDLLRSLSNHVKIKHSKTKSLVSIYRPFMKQFLYYCKFWADRLGILKTFFPSPNTENYVICVSGRGTPKEFAPFVTNHITDYGLVSPTNCFPLYYYDEPSSTHSLISVPTRRDNVSDYILNESHRKYDTTDISKEDIFYYVYGFLHSPDYSTTFANDLKKQLPHVPLVDAYDNFQAFSQAGRDLADLHINYESMPAYPGLVITGAEHGDFSVKKMRFAKVVKDGKKVNDKATIIYNGSITISNIPMRAYDYVVNGKSGIEWVMDRYQVKTDKASCIVNDPNDWCDEFGNERYILDLLCSVVNVSMRSLDIIEGLPKVGF